LALYFFLAGWLAERCIN